jgi:hypothetical protein
MGQTRLDPLDYARMIVHNCLASEFCKLRNTGSTCDLTTTVYAFERYRDEFQVGAPIRHPARSAATVRRRIYPALSEMWSR